MSIGRAQKMFGVWLSWSSDQMRSHWDDLWKRDGRGLVPRLGSLGFLLLVSYLGYLSVVFVFILLGGVVVMFPLALWSGFFGALGGTVGGGLSAWVIGVAFFASLGMTLLSANQWGKQDAAGWRWLAATLIFLALMTVSLGAVSNYGVE